MKIKYRSAKWHEWAVNVWSDKKRDLKSSGRLRTNGWDLLNYIKIIFIINPKYKKLKDDWINKAESKLAELEEKIHQRSDEEKMEILNRFQNQLIDELNDIIQRWLEERK